VLDARGQVERVGRRDLVTGVRLQLQGAVTALAGQVGGDSRDAKVRTQGLDSRAAHGRGVCRAGAGRQSPKDGELGLNVALAGGGETLGRALGRALREEALDVAAPVAAITSGIDAEGGEPAGIGPGADGIGVDAKEGRRLGNADEGLWALCAVTSCVCHAPLLLEGRWKFW